MPKAKVEARQTAETLTPEQTHYEARQAFEQQASAFDGLLKIDKAWLNPGNWLFYDRFGRNHWQRYSFSAEAKAEAADKMKTAHRAVVEAFYNLPTEARQSLATRPTISFDCPGNDETEPAGFEFNLPQIIDGLWALDQLGHQGIHNSSDMLRVSPEDSKTYGRVRQCVDCLFGPLDEAAKFLTGGKWHPEARDSRSYEHSPRRLGPDDELLLARIDQMEKLAETYSLALSNGDRDAESALRYWLRHVNNRILLTTGGPDNAAKMFGIRIDQWMQNVYPYESSMVPIGRTLVIGKNARYMEADRNVWP